MTAPSELFDLFDRATMTDVLVGGYLDQVDGIDRFNLNTTSVYIEFGKHYVRALAGANEYNVTLEIVPGMGPDFPIDDADRFGVSSLLTLLLGDSSVDRWVTRFRALVAAAADANSSTLFECELEFDDGQSLTIAPMVPQGLWIANRAKRRPPAPRTGQFSQLMWQRKGSFSRNSG